MKTCFLLYTVLTYSIFAGFAAVAPGAEQEEFDGLIEPHRVINVGSSVAGVLGKVHVDRGDLIKEGQIVASLNAEVEIVAMELAKARAEMEADILSRRQELEFARREEQRLKKLYKQNVIPERQWDEMDTKRIIAKFRLKEAMENKRLAELELKRAKAVVDRMVIESPVSGVVVERFLNDGEYVEDQPIVKLAQIDPLNIEVILSVEMWGVVSPGMEATVKPEAPVGGTYTAKVIIVDKIIDAASSSFSVRLELPNSEHRIPSGLKCKVIFEIPSKKK